VKNDPAYTITLNNGVAMPRLGFGTYQIPDGKDVERSVLWALEAGYRSIDTAELYGNEAGIGRALKKSGVPRKEVFITTKVWNTSQGYAQTLKAFEQSRKLLDCGYIDQYLVHWPVRGRYLDTWRALEHLCAGGMVRSIGMSNFTRAHCEALLAACEVRPAVNQIECHPLLYQRDLIDYCHEREIRIVAWRPLMKGAAGNIPLLSRLARVYGKTPSQVCLRWLMQHEIIVIPRSTRRERIIENADVFDFTLSDDHMKEIDGLNENRRLGPDPDDFA